MYPGSKHSLLAYPLVDTSHRRTILEHLHLEDALGQVVDLELEFSGDSVLHGHQPEDNRPSEVVQSKETAQNPTSTY